MSYSLIPYRLNEDAFRGSVGSRDDALLRALFDGEPGLETEETDEGEITTGQALRHLIMGENPDASSSHQYGYALERLCAHLGERLDASDLWAEIHWEVLEATGMDQLLEQTSPPVPLPANDSFPAVGYLSAEQVATMAGQVAQGHLKSAAPSGKKTRPSLRSWVVGLLLRRITRRAPMTAEETRELLDEYEEWLREAAAHKQALVFFYY